MSKYHTVNIEKDFYQNLEEYVEQNTDFRNPKEFFKYLARREMEQNNYYKPQK